MAPVDYFFHDERNDDSGDYIKRNCACEAGCFRGFGEEMDESVADQSSRGEADRVEENFF